VKFAVNRIRKSAILGNIHILYQQIYPKISGFNGSYTIAVKIEKAWLRSLEKSKDLSSLRNPDEPYFFQKFCSEIGKSDIVADIGAHHGIYTLSGCIGEKVHSFEMAEENISKLKTKKELVGSEINSKINIVRKGIWSESGEKIFHENSRDARNQIDRGEEKVETLSLDDYFDDREDPNVLKIDVEGAEYQVLEGSESILARSHPTIFLEIHNDGRLSEIGGSEKEIYKLLKEHNYDCIWEKQGEIDKSVIFR
jgi:FkbM family methyltransferase